MAIDVVIEFIAKTTVRILAYVYDDDDALVDPTTSIKVSIYDPDGEKQLLDDPNYDIAMTQVNATTGVYEYYYKTTVDSTKGWWRGEVEVIDGTAPDDKTSIGAFPFRIK